MQVFRYTQVFYQVPEIKSSSGGLSDSIKDAHQFNEVIPQVKTTLPPKDPKFILRDTSPSGSADGILNIEDLRAAEIIQPRNLKDPMSLSDLAADFSLAGSPDQIGEYVAQQVASGVKIFQFGNLHQFEPTLVEVESIRKTVALGKTVVLGYELSPKTFQGTLAMIKKLDVNKTILENKEAINTAIDKMENEYSTWIAGAGNPVPDKVQRLSRQLAKEQVYGFVLRRYAGADIEFIDKEHEQTTMKNEERNDEMVKQTEALAQKYDVVFLSTGLAHSLIKLPTKAGMDSYSAQRPVGLQLKTKYGNEFLSFNCVPSIRNIATLKEEPYNVDFDAWDKIVYFKL